MKKLGFHMLYEDLEKALAEHGKDYEPRSELRSSITCPFCGEQNERDTQKSKIYTCGKCGIDVHIDIIGALNILNIYLGSSNLFPSFSYEDVDYIEKPDKESFDFYYEMSEDRKAEIINFYKLFGF